MHVIQLVLLSLAVCCLLSSSSALDPGSDLYDQGPVRIDGQAEIWYGVDLNTKTAYLAVKVNDSAVINKDSTKTWIGLGISEPTSGSMLGADVVTAEHTSDNTCTITDRYVPFYAYPLGESTADSPSAFPLEDDCQDDDSWKLVSCERDLEAGEMVLEVSRSLDAHDTQDRDIVEGLNSIIYAYGNRFEYHGGNRGAIKVVLYQDGKSTSGKPITAEPELPDDVDGTFEVLATDYVVPSNQTTTYSCTSKRFDLGDKSKRMIIGAEPILDAPIDMVHHFTLYLCRNEAYAEMTKETTTCMSLNGIDGPLANPKAGCSTFVFGYAKGAGRMLLPKEAGIVVDGKRQFLVMETHFDNGDLVEGNIDKSGVRVFYTDTMREHEAGSLLIGDSIVSRFGDKVKTDFKYENTCPSECTSKFKRSINVYASLLHMHTTGKEIYTNVHAKNDTYLRNLNKINFWSDRFQSGKMFDPPFIVKAGEQLSTTCVYDTTKRPETKFGGETKDEMCMDFLGYWPVQRDGETGEELNLCAYFRSEEGGTGTLCGDNGMVSEKTILAVPNPKFEDTGGAETSFGEEVGMCEMGEEMDATVTPEVGNGSDGSEMGATVTPEVGNESGGSETGDGAGGESAQASVEAGAEEEEEEEEEEGEACFPGSARVELRNGLEKRMKQVRIGDEVLVGAGKYSRVFMLTHRDGGRAYQFVEMGTASGARVRMTGGHYVRVRREGETMMRMGREVLVGDFVRVADGSWSEVQAKRWSGGTGLFNPHTVDGEIVVDGVVVSCYTKAVGVGVAHALLAPLRAAFWALCRGTRVGGFVSALDTVMLDKGMFS